VAESSEDAGRLAAAGVPFFCPSCCGRPALEAAGPDGLEWVSRPSWGDFVRPKIAFRGGWAGPGTSLQDADKFRLVSSFREVLSSAENLNLQMFHREGDGSPPALAAHLQWPAPELLHGGAGGAEGTLDVPCDVATRVSRAGAVTWWHLDDGGEHVLQVALPLPDPAAGGRGNGNGCATGAGSPGESGDGGGDVAGVGRGPPLASTSRGKVVKVFLFLPREWYDLAMQDREANKTGKCHCLDPFAGSDNLPGCSQADCNPVALPEILVAAVEAGGRALLSVPNVPHMVITVRDCVLVEERKIMKAFMDEVSYFLRRKQAWEDAPILYPFIQETIRDAVEFERCVVDPLLDLLERHWPAEGAGAGPSEAAGGPLARERSLSACIWERALVSVEAIQRSREFFALGEGGRQRIAAVLAKAGAGVGGGRAGGGAVKAVSGEGAVGGCCLWRRGTDLLSLVAPGVHRFECSGGGEAFVAYIHVKGSPQWGPLRAHCPAAKADRKLLLQARRNGRLPAVLQVLREGPAAAA